MTDHLLDRPVWNALTTRQASLAMGTPQAVRFRPAVNLFGAAADESLEARAALAGLFPVTGTLGTLERAPSAPVPGTVVQAAHRIDQMVLTELARRAGAVEIVPLGAADAPDMLALTALTTPGPFFAETYLQGGYVGVRQDGRLIAMAGQRMKPPGFTEISAVCTHPDHRGKGLARALMEAVIAPILASGEAVFLHTYPDNPAVQLYRALGFRTRATMTYTLLERAP